MSTLRSPEAALVAEEMERLLQSEALRRAPTHTRLLRYLVENGIAGDNAALRETSIAITVFRRDPTTYDPQSDPIVRVTARRLRDRLVAHYATFDRLPKVRITLPKGRYAPVFVTSGEVTALDGIAVTQMRNATGDPRHDAPCAAFADRVADHLAAMGAPRIIARDSTARAEMQHGSAREMAETLGVGWLVQSTLEVDGDNRLRATARLINAVEANVQWVEARTDADAHRFQLLDAIADRVYARFAEQLQGHGRPIAGTTAMTLTADERETLDFMAMLLRDRRDADADALLPALESIAAARPDCAAAFALMARVNARRPMRMDYDPATAYAAARAHAERALAIDPDNPDAGWVLATLTAFEELRPDEACRRLRSVLRRYPHLTVARITLAGLLMYAGSFDEALNEAATAQIYDPLSPVTRTYPANILAYARRHAEARREWAMVRRYGNEPYFTNTLAGNNELWAGAVDAAEALYIASSKTLPDNPTPLMCLAWVDATRGNADRALAAEAACIARYPQTSAFQCASLRGILRDRTGVLTQLAIARERHDPMLLSACVDPAFGWMAGDPDFDALLRSWGLPGWRGAKGPAPA